jgi:ankyrin repeat protein
MANNTLEFVNLCVAARKGELEHVKQALHADRDLVHSVNNYGRTLLHWSARNGHTAVVQFLVEQGKAELDAIDKDGVTALHSAADEGHLDGCHQVLDAMWG